MCFSFLFFLVSYSNTLVHFFSIHPDNTDIDGSDELPDDFDVDAEMDVDIEADVENVPNEVLETYNIPDSREFENMLDSDVQDMADYAAQYDGSREDIGDLEDYGDAEVDMDADFGDVDVVEDPIEPETNFEADIDISEIADIAEGAEEASELIAALL